MKKLPKTLWAIRVNEGTPNEFISAGESIDEMDHGAVVGEYTLTSLNKKSVLHQLDAQTKKK